LWTDKIENQTGSIFKTGIKIAFNKIIVISKIDPKNILSPKTFNPSISHHNGFAVTDFQSLMKERLEISSPLEINVIELLKQTIEIILSQALVEEEDFCLPLPLSSNQSPSPPSIEIPQMSNNLQQHMNLEPIVEEASRKYDVDRDLIKAVIEVESAGNPLAISHAGAQGLMQLMPGTAADMDVANPFDPVQNVMGGTRYLRQLLDRYQGNVRLALSAYNWGMGNLERRPEAMPKETRNYIAKVERLLTTS
jgi:hypothetical protein